MIISFNPSIFQSNDVEVQSILAKILLFLMETDIHFMDIRSINSIFYNENGKYIFNLNPISEFLSRNHQKSLEELLKKKSRINITNLHRAHLTHIVVGLNESDKEIHPRNVYNIIKERSKVIVENGISDWNFIQGICQKYGNSRTKRQSIYQLIDRAMRSENIESEHAGGVGEMINVMKRWVENDRYKDISRYKLMAIFDSDRDNSNQLTGHMNLIVYLKSKEVLCTSDCHHEPNDLMVWHVLYKKKIENYIPLNVLMAGISSIKQEQKNDLKSKTDEELDFIEYDHNNIGLGKDQRKQLLPKMFLSNFSYRDFEERCKHHQVFLPEVGSSVSEIEQILLKIAKIL